MKLWGWQRFNDTVKTKQSFSFYHSFMTSIQRAYRFTFKYMCNKELSKNTKQNPFIKIRSKQESLDETRPLNRFLFTALRNDILNILRDSKKQYLCLGRLPRTIGENKLRAARWRHRSGTVGTYTWSYW